MGEHEQVYVPAESKKVARYTGSMKTVLIAGALVLLPVAFIQAASADYYLKIEGVEGDSSSAPGGTAIQVSQTTTSTPERSSATGTSVGSIAAPDTEEEGNVEFDWKVEKGESAAASDMFLKLPPIDGELQESGSREILVVGSKVRGWDPETKKEILGAAPKSADEVKTEADLALFAAAAASDDMPMEEVAFNYGKIVVKYRGEGRLLGFIPHTFVETATLDTDASGKARVKVKFPWYRFLLTPDVSAAEIEEEAAQADKGHKQWIEVLSAGAGASIEAQAAAHAEAFNSLSNILKTKHDTAKNSIGNIR